MRLIKFLEPPLRDVDPAGIAARVQRMKAPPGTVPAASIVIPVNALGDLQNVRSILADLSAYEGQHRLEFILVVNNFPPEQPPREEIAALEALGAAVLAIPSVRKPGEAVGFSARIPGVRAAASETVVLFDSDCRIPNPTALIDWYIAQFGAGADAAYTPVGYYDYPDTARVEARMIIHYSSRWVKRVVFRIPTTRGSNYAVRRSLMLSYYDQGWLADEMNVGPTFKRKGGRVVFGNGKALTVLTSGRMYTGKSWLKMGRHFLRRLRYNLRVLPVRDDVILRTGREKDPIRRFDDSRKVE